MPTTVSAVSISNRALQRLSATRIESLNQDHPNARSCKAAYDHVRRRMLRAYAWSFAKSRDSIAADADQTEWGELNRYRVPNDFVRLLRPTDERVDWEIEGRYIVTGDSSPLEIRYIFDEENPANFDPLFVEAFSCLLAHEICEEVTGSLAKRKQLKEDMRDILSEAKLANAFERDADVPLEDDFILAMM